MRAYSTSHVLVVHPLPLAPGTNAIPAFATQARAFYGFQVAIENIHSGKA